MTKLLLAVVCRKVPSNFPTVAKTPTPKSCKGSCHELISTYEKSRAPCKCHPHFWVKVTWTDVYFALHATCYVECRDQLQAIQVPAYSSFTRWSLVYRYSARFFTLRIFFRTQQQSGWRPKLVMCTDRTRSLSQNVFNTIYATTYSKVANTGLPFALHMSKGLFIIFSLGYRLTLTSLRTFSSVLHIPLATHSSWCNEFWFWHFFYHCGLIPVNELFPPCTGGQWCQATEGCRCGRVLRRGELARRTSPCCAYFICHRSGVLSLTVLSNLQNPLPQRL